MHLLIFPIQLQGISASRTNLLRMVYMREYQFIVMRGAVSLIISDGFGILHMLAFSTGHWARNSFFKIPSVSYYSLFSSGDSFTTGLEVCLFPFSCCRRANPVAIDEEKFLATFFGDEYVRYRRRVGTKIPLIP